MRRDVVGTNACAWAIFAVSLLAHPAWAQSADLAVVKTDGSTTSVPGTSITYTIQVTNHGPDPVIAAQVSDVFPAALQGVTWVCSPSLGANCTPAGSGNIADAVDLPVGGVVTYTASATIDAGATGTLTNTASVAVPPGVTDPNGSNNSSTDVNTLTPTADLTISKSDGSTTAVPGTSITYTIVVANSGPSHVTGATVIDNFPAALQGITWSCTATPGSSCTSSGTGNIADSVNIRASGSLTYTVFAIIDPAATGTLANTAQVLVPGGVTDPDPGSNASTDSDTLTPEADLGVTKTNGYTVVTAGLGTNYTLVITNSGPSDAPGTLVEDYFPPELSGVSWTCSPSGGASCTPSGAGDIVELVDLPVGSSVTIQVSATVDPCAGGSVANTATVTPDPEVDDPDLSNNSSTDTDGIQSVADLVVSVSDSPDPVLVCNFLSWEITVTNLGPSCADDVEILNSLPAGVAFDDADPGCVDSLGTQTCSIGSLDPGESETVTITGLVSRSLKGAVIVDQTSVSTSTTDSNLANNALATSTDVKLRDPYVVSLVGAPRFLRSPVSETVNYSLKVTSLCDPSVASSDVAVVSSLPEELEFVDASPAPSAVFDHGAEFEVPVLQGLETASFDIRARLAPGVPPGTELTHSVELSDSVGPGGRAAATVYVRGVAPDKGKLKVRFGVPRKTFKGASLQLRLGIDNTSIAPAPDVEAALFLPGGLELISANPEPVEIDRQPGGTLVRWTFESIARKALLRVVVKVGDDFFDGDMLNLNLEAVDGWGRFAETTRDVIVRVRN